VVGHGLEGIMQAPEKYPDIYVVWNLTVSIGDGLYGNYGAARSEGIGKENGKRSDIKAW